MPYKDKKDDKKRKVRRLVDVDVTHVSLVDRPANRTPFKFVKREETPQEKGIKPMNIHLKNMFGSRGPEVTSVIADSRDKALAVAKMLLEGETAQVTEQDGVFVARKSGTESSPEERLIHLGKSVGVAYTVTNLRKELRLYDMETEEFDDAVKQEGFVPGLMIGMEALHTTIRNIAMSEDTNSPETFRDKVQNAMQDFNEYVSSLIEALPAKAFKFEKAVAAVAHAPDTPLHYVPEGFHAEVHDALFGASAPAQAPAQGQETPAPATATPEPAPQASAPESPAPAPAAQETQPPAQATATAPEQADPADTKPSNLEELPPSQQGAQGVSGAQMNAALEEMLESLTKKVGDQIENAVKPLAARLDATDGAVSRLTKAVGGQVATTPEEDGNVVHLAKGQEQGEFRGGGEPPLMDTAYMKRG